MQSLCFSKCNILQQIRILKFEKLKMRLLKSKAIKMKKPIPMHCC